MPRLSLFFCAAAILLISGPASTGTAAGTAVSQDAAAHQLQVSSDEWSSASKPKRKRPTVTVYQDAPGYRYGWRPADPSFDQYGRPYRNPFPGQCMIDLGYGRWESCDQVGGR